MLGALAIGERMDMDYIPGRMVFIGGGEDDLVIEGKAESPLIFTRGPTARRSHLDPKTVTVWMDDNAAWNGQVLSESDVQRLFDWLDEIRTREWYCTTHEEGGSACGSETCSVGREHQDTENCSPVRR